MATLPRPRDDLGFRLSARRRVTRAIVELWLAPEGEHMPYLPGQYLLLGPQDDAVEPRSYSMASAPRLDGHIRLFVTREPGGETSGWIHDRLAAGEGVLVSGPYGTFVCQEPPGRPLLGLAGGSGLAPILAIAEGTLRGGGGDPVAIVFSARSEADVFDREELAAWSLRYPNFRFLRTLTRRPGPPPVGHIQNVLPDLFPDLSEHLVFVAGAPGFVEAARAAIERCRAVATLVHEEAFLSDPRPW